MTTSELTFELLDKGAWLLAFWGEVETWVKRRVDHVEFDDDVVFCTRTTLDIELDAAQIEELPEWRGRFLLPVHRLRRDLEVDVTVHDSQGIALPQLTRRDERSLVAAALTLAYDGQAPDLQNVYSTILRNIDPELQAAGDTLIEGGAEFDRLLDDYKSMMFAIAAIQPAWSEELRSGKNAETRDEGARSDASRATADHSSGVMFRIVVTRSDAARPRESVAQDQPDLTAAEPELDKRLGDRTLRLPAQQVDACESYHFEFRAPDGTIVKEARLKGMRGTRDRWLDALTHPDPKRRAEAFDKLTFQSTNNEIHLDRAHLFFSADRSEDDAVLFGASALIVLRPMTSGTTRAGVTASMLATGVLIALLFTIGWRGSPGSFGWVHYAWDTPSVVALLLLGPTLLSTVIVREHEHQLSKRVLRGYRNRIGGQAIATFAAAYLYAAGVPDRARWAGLLVLAVVSAGLTVVTIRSYRVSLGYVRSRGRPYSEPGGA